MSIQKWLLPPISAVGKNFNPRNINHMTVVKIFARLELDETISFLDGHWLGYNDPIKHPPPPPPPDPEDPVEVNEALIM